MIFDSLRKHLGLGAVIFSMISLSACTSVDYAGLSSSLTTVSAKPRYGDSDPITAWQGGAPFGFPVHGVDVAKYQGDLDWKTLKQQGVEFAFIKATEGGDLLDPMYAKHTSGARQARIPNSAYHFYYFCTSAKKQAEWFIRNVPRIRGSLPHVLDMEWNPHSPTCKLRPPAEIVRREMEIFMRMIERHYGKRPIIYTTVDFHEENLAGHFKNDSFWLRSVKAHPKVTYPGRPFTFWQYTGTGRVKGATGDIDLNVFYGSRDQWREWVKRSTR